MGTFRTGIKTIGRKFSIPLAAQNGEVPAALPLGLLFAPRFSYAISEQRKSAGHRFKSDRRLHYFSNQCVSRYMWSKEKFDEFADFESKQDDHCVTRSFHRLCRNQWQLPLG
jgi:hypothetical protein